MKRLHLLVLLALLGGAALQAQESQPEADPASSAAEKAAAEEAADDAADADVTDEEIDELLGLDEDYTEIEDDDFDFTEDVRFEQSTDFPVDI